MSEYAGFRYAQEFGGQQLHIVQQQADGTVAGRAACGREPKKRGAWRMTINVPLGHCCKNCQRAMAAGWRRAQKTI